MRRISKSAIAIMACMLAAVSSVAAQDLGEAARLERERKANLAHHAAVITNEDFAKKQIVVPQAEAPAVAATPAPQSPIMTNAAAPVVASTPAESSPLPAKASVTKVSPILVRVLPATTATQSISPQPGDPGFSLGEYARKLREQKAERLAKEQELERQAAAAAVVASAPKAPAEAHVSSVPARSLQAVKILLPRHEVTNDVAKVVTKRDRPVETRTAVTNDDHRKLAKSAIEVRRGDSLWRISRRNLGHGHLWMLVWKTNPQIANPEVIRVGQTLQLPSAETVAAALANETMIRVAKAEPKTRNAGKRTFAIAMPGNAGTRFDTMSRNLEQPGGASFSESGREEASSAPMVMPGVQDAGAQSPIVTSSPFRPRRSSVSRIHATSSRRASN